MKKICRANKSSGPVDAMIRADVNCLMKETLRIDGYRCSMFGDKAKRIIKDQWMDKADQLQLLLHVLQDTRDDVMRCWVQPDSSSSSSMDEDGKRCDVEFDTWVANRVAEHYKQYTALSYIGDDDKSVTAAHATWSEERPQPGSSTAADCARTISLHGRAEHPAPAAVAATARCGSLHLPEDPFGVMTPPKTSYMPHFSRGSSSAGGAIPGADDDREGHLSQQYQHPTMAWCANQVWDDGEGEEAAAEEANFDHFYPCPPWPVNGVWEGEGLDEEDGETAADEAAALYTEGFRLAHLPQLPAQQLCAVMRLLAGVQQALVSGDHYAACNMVAGGISGAWRAHALVEAREAQQRQQKQGCGRRC